MRIPKGGLNLCLHVSQLADAVADFKNRAAGFDRSPVSNKIRF
jgi:hypothetical protein